MRNPPTAAALATPLLAAMLAAGPVRAEVAEEFTCAITRECTLDECTTPDHGTPVRLVIDFTAQSGQIGDETILFPMDWLGEDVTGFNWLVRREGYGFGLVTLSPDLVMTATAHELDHSAESATTKVSTLIAQCEPAGQE